jgi:hypothetical protein
VIFVSNQKEDLTLSLNQFQDHKIKVKEEECDMKEKKMFVSYLTGLKLSIVSVSFAQSYF